MLHWPLVGGPMWRSGPMWRIRYFYFARWYFARWLIELSLAALGARLRKVSMFNPWFSLTLKTIQLGVEAQSVVALRMMRLAAGGAGAPTEARRMIADKIAAGVELQGLAASSLASGRGNTVVAEKTLRVLKKRVRANKRRLSRR
jgi:hypothetical protein